MLNLFPPIIIFDISWVGVIASTLQTATYRPAQTLSTAVTMTSVTMAMIAPVHDSSTRWR